jgi:ubiquinol-cytochrome c reductase cytochrome b subunit
MRLLTRTWQWIDERTGIAGLMEPLLHHPVPARARWLYVFGSATLVAFLVQVVTGVALATLYVPSTGEAYQSLQFITDQATLGRVVRGMHYWGASAMVVLVGIHLLRVFLFGSYKYPREVNWMTGVALLGLTLGMAFTGQLLRWDQNAVWSVVVGAEQAGKVPVIGRWLAEFLLGGSTLGGSTLSRFFAVHVLVLPILIAGGVAVHLALVLRNGISEPPRVGEPVDPASYRDQYRNLVRREGVPFWPDTAWRDLVFGLVVVAAVLVLALVFGPAALDNLPDPTLIDAHPRPDWYFWWYFAVLAYLPPALENLVIVLAPVLGLILLLALPVIAGRGERHPLRRPWALGLVLVGGTVLAALTVAGKKENWSPRFDAAPLTASEIGAASGPVFEGGRLFNQKGCLYCHSIEGHGGHRGPDLTLVGNRLTAEQMMLRIANGAPNMPSFAGILTARELQELVEFLTSRRSPGVERGQSDGGRP